MSAKIEDNILRSLRRIGRCIDLYSRKLAARYKLTGPQLICLRYLVKHGPHMPSALAREVSLSQATVTGILDRLENKKLVYRARSTKDKRRVIVTPTESGREIVESAPSPLHETFTRKLRVLPKSDQEEIDASLHLIVEMMEAEDLEAAPVLTSGPILAEPAEVVDFFDTKKST